LFKASSFSWIQSLVSSTSRWNRCTSWAEPNWVARSDVSCCSDVHFWFRSYNVQYIQVHYNYTSIQTHQQLSSVHEKVATSSYLRWPHHNYNTFLGILTKKVKYHLLHFNQSVRQLQSQWQTFNGK
jgi:hypothetical protein